jgi:hypothetical protein
MEPHHPYHEYLLTIMKDEKPSQLKAPFIAFSEKEDKIVDLDIGAGKKMKIFFPQKTFDIHKYFEKNITIPRNLRSMVIALLRLLKDYKTLCSSIFELDTMIQILEEDQDENRLRKYVPIFDIDKQKIILPSSIQKQSLSECQTDFIILPLLFMSGSESDLNKIKSLTSETWMKSMLNDTFQFESRLHLGNLMHVGLLLFFPKEGKATYIDPNGASTEKQDYPNLEYELMKLFDKLGYTYEVAENYCPRFGSLSLVRKEYQETKIVESVPILKDGGFCVIWTFAMILHLALNPEMKSYSIFQRLNALLSGRMIPYTLFLLSYFEKYIMM